MYPSEMYEYDPFLFDPTTSMGSPIGGFARATMSRLASLPIRFVVGSAVPPSSSSYTTGAGFYYPTTTLTDADSTVIEAPHFTMYDAHGQLLVCRVYNEDELSVESITQSMLDVAIDASSSSSTIIDTEMSQDMVESDTGHSLQAKVVEDKDTHQHPKQQSSITATATAAATTTIHNEEIRTQLKKLKGICSQLSTGFWNYQWCHETHMLQFHSVHDLTVVGYYDETARRI